MSNPTDGHKVEIAIGAAAAVTITAIVFDPTLAPEAITAFFGFLGGLVMGKVF